MNKELEEFKEEFIDYLFKKIKNTTLDNIKPRIACSPSSGCSIS